MIKCCPDPDFASFLAHIRKEVHQARLFLAFHLLHLRLIGLRIFCTKDANLPIKPQSLPVSRSIASVFSDFLEPLIGANGDTFSQLFL